MIALLAFLAGHELFWHGLRHVFRFIAIFGSFTSTVFLGMVLVAALRYTRRSREARRSVLSTPQEQLPAVTILKPVHGTEPRLEENLESFFRQDYPEFEIVFGARDAGNEALRVVERLQAKYPQVKSRIVLSGEPSWPNAKVYSLGKMILSSSSEYLVISDSDILVGPDFLRNVVPPLLDPAAGLVTCLYRGIPAPDFWSQLEALGMSIEMPAGVIVADMMEGMRFALGAVMAVRRDAIEAIGGFREAADFYSDDFVLGNRVAEAGFRVVLSHYKVGHVLVTRSLAKTFGDQLRWMKSTRYSRPKGHLGSGLTYAVPFGLLAMLTTIGRRYQTAGIELFLMAWLNRMLLALAVGWGLIRDRRALWLCWLYPLRDLIGFCTWVGSYCGSTFLWRGETYQFGYEGRITPAERAVS